MLQVNVAAYCASDLEVARVTLQHIPFLFFLREYVLLSFVIGNSMARKKHEFL